MSHTIRRAQFFNTCVKDEPGEAYKVLTILADLGVNLLAFTAVPIGPMTTQLTLFPDDPGKLTAEATRAGLDLDGPHPALLVSGDDELGALASIHRRLYQASVNVYASSGVSDGKGCYGYVIYLRPEDFERSARALELR